MAFCWLVDWSSIPVSDRDFLEGKTPFRRLRRKRKNNIRTNLKETGLELWTGFVWFRIGTSDGIL
jgi:hypothetical protein